MKNPSIAESAQLDPKAIGQLAFQLWDKAGRPSGKDLDFWLEAERQLQAAAQPVPVIPMKMPVSPAKEAVAAKPPKAKLTPSRLARR
jgi:hypothetical protein